MGEGRGGVRGARGREKRGFGRQKRGLTSSRRCVRRADAEENLSREMGGGSVSLILFVCFVIC